LKIDFKSCTEEELWKYVASHLSKRGIDTILVGGAVAAIYSNGLYRSGDLDFIHLNMFVKGLEEVMNEIGFKKMDTRRYQHPECKHILVEFPGGPPVGIGEDYKIKPNEVKFEGTTIKIFSPTDCVKDRLAGYIYYKHEENLNQAAMVAKSQKVNYAKIQQWCENEKAGWAYDSLIKKVKETKL
jgi:hypothetical protein